MPGYPAWWANRPAGLWVVSSKGGTPKMIAPEAPWRVTWSPDSRRLVFNDSHSKTHVVDVVTGKTVSSPVSPFEEYPTVVGWRTAGELLLLWKDNLMGWSPDKPDALPRIVARKWYFGNHGFRGSALSPDGATMAITYEGGFREGSSLWTLPVANLSAKPVAVADKLAAGYNPVWTREGLFSYSTDNADLTDIAGRTNKRWQSPEEIALLRGVPANYGASAIALSPDGNLLAFGGYRDLFKRTGYTLFVADADGKNAHELFPPF